jgi:DNA-binding NtrC family response regulator
MGTVEDKYRVIVWAQEPGWVRALSWILNGAGFEVTNATSESQAIAWVSQSLFHTAVLDLAEPLSTGTQVVHQIHRACPAMPIILTSSLPKQSPALMSIHDHVHRHIRRPDDLDLLAQAICDAIATRGDLPQSGNGHNDRPSRSTSRIPGSEGIAEEMLVGDMATVRNARRLAAQVAPSDMTVLIRGESGTGKDVVARLIHRLSKRATTGDFVKINCPAISESLLESELFGHERGAFTGAVAHKPGRFELADGGTIFLDEIGLMSMTMQGKLLDVIEQKQFVRVGGKETIHVDARIIAATNAPLEEMIAAGAFRPDLFYRLRQFSITLPALRERREDIPLLCRHFLRLCETREGFQHTQLEPEIMPLLLRYNWPGNVRELEALMARYALCGDRDSLEQVLMPAAPVSLACEDKLEAAELTTILAALTECRWNRRKAAAALGISYSALRRRMAKHHIDHPSAPPAFRSIRTC